MCLTGLKKDSTQGDRAVLELTKKMGGKWEWKGDDLWVYPSVTNGIEIDVRDIPDAVPVLSVLAAVSQGETRIVNAARLRIKESDRLQSTTDILKKLGANIVEMEDGLVIQGAAGFTGSDVDAWNDHRIAMSVAIASTRATGEIALTGSESVNKSYPHFWEEFQRLGGIVHE